MPSFWGFLYGSPEHELEPRTACKLLIGCILSRVQGLKDPYCRDNLSSSHSFSCPTSSFSSSFSCHGMDSFNSSDNDRKIDLLHHSGESSRSSSATRCKSWSCCRIPNCRREESLKNKVCGDSVTEKKKKTRKQRSTRGSPKGENSVEINESVSSLHNEESLSNQSSCDFAASFSSCSESYSHKASASSPKRSSSFPLSSFCSTLSEKKSEHDVLQSGLIHSRKEHKVKSHHPAQQPPSPSPVHKNSTPLRVSPFLIANIASFMISPDTTLLMISRREIQTVESIGDTFKAGEVVSRPEKMEDVCQSGNRGVENTCSNSSEAGNVVHFRFLRTNYQHVVAVTTEGILIMSPPSLTPTSDLHTDDHEEVKESLLNTTEKKGLKNDKTPSRRTHVLMRERKAKQEVKEKTAPQTLDLSIATSPELNSRTPLHINECQLLRSTDAPTTISSAPAPPSPSPTTPSSIPLPSSPCSTLRKSSAPRTSHMQVVGQQPLHHPSECIYSLTCSPDGNFVITGFENGSISVYFCYSSLNVSPSGDTSVASSPGSSTSHSKVSMHLLYDFTGHTDAVDKLHLTRKYRDVPFPAGMNTLCNSRHDPYSHHHRQPSRQSPNSSERHPTLECPSLPFASASALFAETTPLLLYSAGHEGRICQWDLEKGTLRYCIHYHDLGVQVLEVAYWSGLIAIATHQPILVVHRACERGSLTPPLSHLTTPYHATFPARSSFFHDNSVRERELGGYDGMSSIERLEQQPSDASAQRMWPVETGSFLMRTYPFSSPSSLPIATSTTQTSSVTHSSTPSPSTSSVHSSSVPTEEVWYECPRLMLEVETLISGAHDGSITSAKFTNDSEWIVSLGEDEVITLSSIKEPRQTFRCLEGLTRHTCMALFNVLLSVCIIASPPASSVIVVLACSSDGTLIQWLVDPRDGRSSYTKKTNTGTLISVDMYERIPRRMLYF